MNITIKRQKSPDSAPYLQIISYEIPDREATVATLLRALNAAPGLTDTEGKPVGEIFWECSCLQKKCGACAMRINGVPRLACDTKLCDLRGERLTLEPLRKFPVVRDLIVDRSLMRENLKAINAWLEQEARHTQKGEALAYDASRCLQCGCCLEVCPNFTPGGSFYGAAAFVPVSRILSELPKQKKYDVIAAYKRGVYSGCGKSLACHDVCPADIDVESKLANSNAVAIWKRFFSK